VKIAEPNSDKNRRYEKNLIRERFVLLLILEKEYSGYALIDCG
jgi:hypothetical protein